jgi:hypothetical protein
MRLFLRKAVVLIKYVEAELYQNNYNKKKKNSQKNFFIREKSPTLNLEIAIVKKIKLDLDIVSEQDFAVLLGIAEKTSPGIYVALAGDPASIEEKV